MTPASRAAATLALAVAVVVAMVAAVLSGGWVEGAGLSMVAALVGLAEAALLTVARARRWVVVIVLPLMLAVAVVPVTLGTLPSTGERGLSHTAGLYLDALTGGLSATSDWAFFVALCAALWFCAFWLGWLVLREGRGVIGTLPCYTVLAINALNAPSLSRLAAPEAVAAGLCLLLVGQCHLNRLASHWRFCRLPVIPGLRRRFAVSAVVATMGVVGIAMVVPPVTSRDVSSTFFAAKVRPPQAAAAPRSSGGAAAGAAVAFSRNTRPGGPLASRPRPALVFTTDGPAGDYLRLVNDTTFEAGNWLPGGPSTATSPGNGALTRDRDPAHGGVSSVVRQVHTTTTYSALAAQDAPFLAFTAEPDGAGGAGAVQEAGVAATRFTPLLTVDQVTPQVLPAAGAQVTTTGERSTATAAQLRAAGTAYPSFTSAFTLLPDDRSGGVPTVRSLAVQWTAGAANPYDQALAIQSRLRDPRLFTYDLSPPVGPDSQWPIAYFLTTSHRGYCQYFASSMGAMLRSLGIPTRLVNGYGPGVVSPGTAAGVTVHALTTSDAHTWVEAYFPRYGWISFEPTPASPLGDYQAPERGIPVPQVVPAAAPTPTPAPVASPTPSPAAAPLSRPRPPATGSSRGPVLLLAGLAAASAAATVAWWLRPPSLRALWRRIRLFGRLIRVRRAPSETDAAYAARLAAALPAAGAGVRSALTEIAALSGSAQFSASGRGAARAAWGPSAKTLLASTPALLWRRLRRSRPRG